MERDPMEMALSTDVVMGTILSNLKVKDLLACRQVSKFWSKAASSVLRKRSTRIKNISDGTDLMELGRCMKQSLDFPFAGLKFIEPWNLSSAGAMEFCRGYGERFTSLHLGTSSGTRLQDLAEFVNHLPRLSILEVGWNWVPAQYAELFFSTAEQEAGRILNLPSLRTFRISSKFNEDALNEDVVRGVLAAASPYLQIELMVAGQGILEALKSAGKLQAVSDMTVKEYEPREDLRLAEFLSTESPALTKLDLSGNCFLSLKKLLISSEHTLKELRLEGICPSHFTSECPVLENLTELSLSVCIVYQSYEYVFQGRQGHKFPALKQLKLEKDDQYNPSIYNLSDGLFIVPSLTMIDLVSCHVDKDGILDLARSFPNVVEVRVSRSYYDHGLVESNPRDIWSVGAFKFLEKLRIWDYTIKPPPQNEVNMDSFLTGTPIEICENLRNHTQLDLVDFPLNKLLRTNPNLKELTVCVKLEDGLEDLPEDPPFISMVSVWYALQMMPNLEAKFLYEHSSPSWGFQEGQRDKAVKLLKSAFKHVQPYVELEPFFY